MLAAAKDESVFSLAAALLSENSRRGFATSTNELHRAFRFANSNTATGLDVCLYDDGRGSRSTGKERDAESGLDYFGARYYGSALGRFTSPDWSAKPVAIPYAKLENPQSLNLYAYLLNNPLRGVDPDGHDGCPQGQPGCKNGTQTTTTGAPLTPSPENHAAADKNPARLEVNTSSGGPKGGEIDYTLTPAKGDTNNYTIVQAETNKDRTGGQHSEFGEGTSKDSNTNQFQDTIQPGVARPANNSIQTFYMVPVDNSGKPLGPPQPVNVRDQEGHDFYSLGVYFSATGNTFVNGRQVTSTNLTPPGGGN